MTVIARRSIWRYPTLLTEKKKAMPARACPKYARADFIDSVALESSLYQ
jgi:hypothetical protein